MIRLYLFLFLFVKKKRFLLNDTLLPNGMEHIIKKTSSGGTCAVGVEEKANAISSRLLFLKVKQKIDLIFKLRKKIKSISKKFKLRKNFFAHFKKALQF